MATLVFNAALKAAEPHPNRDSKAIVPATMLVDSMMDSEAQGGNVQQNKKKEGKLAKACNECDDELNLQ